MAAHITQFVVSGIEFSGPILIKLGQWASTRRDLFPDSCCSQFSRLQRRIKPHSWRFTTHQMKRAFGSNWRKIFVKFDNDGNPIGSGCVAQVGALWYLPIRPGQMVPQIHIVHITLLNCMYFLFGLSSFYFSLYSTISNLV